MAAKRAPLRWRSAWASARMAGGSCARMSSLAPSSTSSRTSGGKLAIVVARSSSAGPASDADPEAAAACVDAHPLYDT